MKWSESDAQNARFIVDRLGKVLKLQADGNVTLGFGSEYEACTEILAKLFGASPEVPETKHREMVKRAVIDAVKANTLTVAWVRSEYDRSHDRYLAIPPHPYVLLSSLSIRYEKFFGSLRWAGSVISFSRQHPKAFTLSDRIRNIEREKPRLPMGFTAVQVRMKARCDFSAAIAALVSSI